jgi:UDP-N-acetylglucosamine 2-epimerase (non-hydrolysing)
MKPVLCVVGARPNFMKMAPLVRELGLRGVPFRLLHTGQHYDDAMSGIFLEQLGMPAPDVDLGVGSGSHALQTARVMAAFEPVVEQENPVSVVVVGDVNSTLACALVAQKMGVPVAHVEAGLRSFDRAMPEETNRVLTDQLAELCLTPSPDADQNLAREGIPTQRIVRVGNVMIDTLLRELSAARALRMHARFEVAPRQYGVVTLHRPSNVDHPARLRAILGALGEVACWVPLIMAVHPRTRAGIDRLLSHGCSLPRKLRLVPPLGYRENVGLVADARLVLTDSGGLQEETTVLGVPCLTLRESTERPITIEQGTNLLVGSAPARIVAAARAVLLGGRRPSQVPPLWDGRAAERIVDALVAAQLAQAEPTMRARATGSSRS